MATKKPAAKAAKPVEEEVVEEVEKTEPEIDLNAYYDELVEFELFKDSEKYKDDVFVTDNKGKGYLIQRGVRMKMPRSVMLALKRSLEQKQAADSLITYFSSSAQEIG